MRGVGGGILDFLQAIAIAGLLAGTLDLVGAFIWAYAASGTTPDVILRYISSAVVGAEAAFQGTNVMIFGGLIIHYFITISWTTLFFLAYPKLGILRGNRMLTCTGFGALIWGVMNVLILPITRLPAAHIKFKGVVIGAAILIVAIGLPVSYLATKYYSSQRR